MAGRRHSNTQYRTYGSAAYAPAYEGSAVRVPQPGEDIRYAPRPRQRPKERALTRTQVQVREAGAVAPFAVVGFLAVGIFAALLLYSYAQFAVLNDRVITARGTLTSLQTEYSTLSAQYEQAFDGARIQSAVGDTMVQPSPEQVVYLDLSEPDAVTVYQRADAHGLAGAAEKVKSLLAGLIEYFR